MGDSILENIRSFYLENSIYEVLFSSLVGSFALFSLFFGIAVLLAPFYAFGLLPSCLSLFLGASVLPVCLSKLKVQSSRGFRLVLLSSALISLAIIYVIA